MMTHVRMITFSVCDSSRKLNPGWNVWKLNIEATALTAETFCLFSFFLPPEWLLIIYVSQNVSPMLAWRPWRGETNLSCLTGKTREVVDGRNAFKAPSKKNPRCTRLLY